MNTATMKARVTGFFVKIIIASLLLILVLYMLAAYEYRDRFPYGTRINGVYCAGLGVDEVSSILDSTVTLSNVSIVFPNGKTYELDHSSIDMGFDYIHELTRLNYGRNPFLWGRYLFGSLAEEKIDPIITYDKDKLRIAVYGLDIFREYNEDADSVVKIDKVDGIYTLVDTTGPVISKEAVFDYVTSVLDNGTTEVVIPDYFVIDHSFTEEEKATLAEWKDVESFITPKIVYDMGDEQIEIGQALLSRILYEKDGAFERDVDGKLAFDETFVREFIDTIADLYETYDKPRTFLDYNGESKTLERNYFGTLIDKKAEEEYLVNAIRSGLKETHKPEYIKEPYHRGLDDIGPTRIEVDLTRQKLYFLKDGKLEIETDVVTGNPNTLHATNEMATSVIKMETDTYLKGEGYRSFVKFWIAVYQNKIGIHDASWQKQFGGERYLTHGSKGCINVPSDVAEKLYSEVEVGVPVLIYK